MIKEKFKEILRFCNEAHLLSGAPHSLRILKDRTGMESLPSDLTEYFRDCVPSSSAARFPVFEPIERILDDFDDDPVANHILSLGYVSFANGRDGGQFAYCLDDEKIYSLHVEAVDADSAAMLKKMAEDCWPSFSSFLDWNLKQVRLG